MTSRVQDYAMEIKALGVVFISALTSFWGVTGWIWLFFVVLMAVDTHLGTRLAKERGEWQSSQKFKGSRGKILNALVVVLVAAGESILGQIINLEAILEPIQIAGRIPQLFFTLVVLLWYISAELGSIIESAGLLGANIPPFLAKGIKVLNTKISNKGEDVVNNIKENDTNE